MKNFYIKVVISYCSYTQFIYRDFTDNVL